MEEEMEVDVDNDINTENCTEEMQGTPILTLESILTISMIHLHSYFCL